MEENIEIINGFLKDLRNREIYKNHSEQIEQIFEKVKLNLDIIFSKIFISYTSIDSIIFNLKKDEYEFRLDAFLVDVEGNLEGIEGVLHI